MSRSFVQLEALIRGYVTPGTSRMVGLGRRRLPIYIFEGHARILTQ